MRTAAAAALRNPSDVSLRHSGPLDAALQLTAASALSLAAPALASWLLLTLPVFVLSTTYPLIQPVLSWTAEAEAHEEADSILIAPVLSAAYAACLVALVPLRIWRRVGVRPDGGLGPRDSRPSGPADRRLAPRPLTRVWAPLWDSCASG